MTTLTDQKITDDVLTTVVKCPSWCVVRANGSMDHHESAPADGPRVIFHTGPSFGRFFITLTSDAETGDPIKADVVGSDVDDVEMDAAALRCLAADAVAAADWIEALR